MLYGVPGFIQKAALEALTNARGEIAVMLEIYRRRRDLVAKALSGLNSIEVLVPEAGMFVLLDVKKQDCQQRLSPKSSMRRGSFCIGRRPLW